LKILIFFTVYGYGTSLAVFSRACMHSRPIGALDTALSDSPPSRRSCVQRVSKSSPSKQHPCKHNTQLYNWTRCLNILYSRSIRNLVR